MSEPTEKTFDCVQNMRRIRNLISEDIAALSYEELVQWIVKQGVCRGTAPTSDCQRIKGIKKSE